MSDKGIKSSFHDNDDGEESSWVPNDLVFGKGNLEAIRHTCEAIGSFMEMWGFKKILGSTWAFLYLCPEPAAAKDICKALNISPALVSITIQDLLRWQVVKKISPMGKRRDYYVAEHDTWKMIRKVLKEREACEITNVRHRLDQAIAALDIETKAHADLKTKRTCQFQRIRLEDLVAITDSATALMDHFVNDGAVDISPIFSLLKPYNFVGNSPKSQ